jgi:hypothetical protein
MAGTSAGEKRIIRHIKKDERPIMNKKNNTELFLFLFIGFDARAENLNSSVSSFRS